MQRYSRVAWLVLLPSMLAGVVVLKELGRRQRAAAADYDTAKLATYAKWESRRAQFARLSDLFHKHPSWSPDDVTRAVPVVVWASRESFTIADSRYEHLTFNDQQTGYGGYLEFRDGRWSGMSVGGIRAPVVPPVPDIARLRTTFRPWLLVRPRFVSAAGLAWVLLVLAGVSLGKYDASVPLTHGALALAVVYVGLAEADPWTRLLSTSNVHVWLGLFAVLVSLLLYPRARRAKTGRHVEQVTNRICCHCGYDLRATPDRCPECGATAPSG